MFLYHYYEKDIGPFVNLSDVPIEEAKAILSAIQKERPSAQSAQRDPDYMNRRHMYEEMLRKEFLKKGGRVQRKAPHYMVVEPCPWLSTWFLNSAFVKIPIEEFDVNTVSFTYGDSHPTFSLQPRKDDWKEYRRKLYTYGEILKIIEKYGLPQNWNGDGKYGPERYVEAQIWSDETIGRYSRGVRPGRGNGRDGPSREESAAENSLSSPLGTDA